MNEKWKRNGIYNRYDIDINEGKIISFLNICRWWTCYFSEDMKKRQQSWNDMLELGIWIL